LKAIKNNLTRRCCC